jgi:hypothetical protein
MARRPRNRDGSTGNGQQLLMDENGDKRDRSDETPSLAEINARDAGADFNFMALVQAAEDRDQTFKGAIQRHAWRKAYAAFHNRHESGSKYESERWRKKRSTIFRPKTRSAVRKNMAAAAASMFSTDDVVNVTPLYDGDPLRSASAEVLQQCLKYRLDRTAGNAGISWFLVAMGAHLDGQTTGVMFTKQFWEYEEVEEETIETVTEAHLYEDTGEPVIDKETGQPLVTQREERQKKTFTTKDRPQSLNIPPDNVILDPAAYWINPCQTSSYLILKFPMTLDEARRMLSNPGKSNEQWLQLDDTALRQVSDDYNSKGVRIARDASRVDKYDNRPEASGERAGTPIVWLYENFWRIDGVDYHFWSVGSRFYASKVRTTRQAYPEQFGERPVVGGYASIETHETYPMAPVSSWYELQKELNDIVNLRLDTMKQALSPIAKVKQGTMFDFRALQDRAGQDTTIIVKDPEDLVFDRAPDVTASAYQETNYINADFDDLAGLFSGSSVNTNRNLNETVGGMRLLNSSASSITEFDIRVWVETWAEPTLRQIVRLEQMWETDETVFAVAGQRAQLQRFGIDSITDEDLMHDVLVKVDVGMGSADPMQKLAKLAQSVEMLGKMAPFFDKKVQINSEKMIKAVMGPAGFNDGLSLFTISDLPQQSGQAIIEQMKLKLDEMKIQNDAEQASADRDNDVQLENIRQRGETIRLLLTELSAMRQAQHTAQNAARQTIAGGMMRDRQMQIQGANRQQAL